MIRIRQIKIDAIDNQPDMILKKLSSITHMKKEDIEYKIKKQSLDARDKSHILYVYDIDVNIKDEEKFLNNDKNPNISVSPKEEYKSIIAEKNKNVVIVGSGPAGLFASLTLVEAGIKPVIIERGECVEKRVETVEYFWKSNTLNKNSNVQFGEGGAGTFSDGKLNTLVSDKFFYGKHVLETFIKFGAPEEILYNYKPHIGTDILVTVIKNIRAYLINKGATFRFNTCMTNLIIENNTLKGIIVNDSEKILCDNLILAIGHSARDTFRMLEKNNLRMEAKPFAVGLRIMHSQEMINESQYGSKYKDFLGPANYKLTYKSSNNHGVYTFCMCPGGYVVNASSEEKRLAVNGMSNYKRESKNANSAVIVTVNESDYGSSLFSGVEFQEMLEEKAYNLGNGNIPIQLVKDYHNNKISTNAKSVEPVTKGSCEFANLNDLLPKELNIAIKEALISFDNKIKGFNSDDAILAGIESRTSSPIKILRDASFSSNIKGIYPCGEGAGYAGGIQTSAIDGIRVAEVIIKDEV